MKLKTKIAASAVILGLTSVANAELTSVSDAALSEITGQAGLTIDMDVKVSIGNIAYTDTDGGSTAPAAAGTLNIGTLEINDGTGATHALSGALSLTGLTVDVDSVNGVEIGLPAITGRISIGSIDMGTGTSIGSVAITDLNMAGTSVNIRGH